MSAAQDRATLRRQWRGLTPAMKKALDEAARAPLRRNNCGWTSTGFNGHSPNTVEALAKRGPLKIDRLAGCCGVASLTKVGNTVFRSVGEPL